MDRLGSSGQEPGLTRVRVAGVRLGDEIEEERARFLGVDLLSLFFLIFGIC
jgi:hypothetical protein